MLADVLRSLPRLALPIPTTCDTFFIHRRALSDFTSRQTSFKAPTSSRNPTASSSPPTSSRTSTSSKAPTSSRPPTSSRTPTSSRIPTSSKAPTSSGAPTPSTTEKIASYPRDPPPSKRLFIKGVHWLTSEKAVRRAFGKLGIVTKVEIARYDDGASRGIGFVEFEDVNDAVYAFEMHKKKPISFRAVRSR
ncbi:hypothetical protein BDQ17DRAFT_1436146 [Cyathus striatus]|nr:hypothetical protein BDQ17DRAFT_1436146 [Cyathus striatus]